MGDAGTMPEILFLSTYDCLGCATPLIARPEQLGGWLRCPVCGRPGLPPSFGEDEPVMARGVVVGGTMPLDDDTLVIGPLFDPAQPERPAGRRRVFSPFRVVMLVILAIAIAWMIEAFLSQSVPAAVIAAVVGAVAFYAMTRRGGR